MKKLLCLALIAAMLIGCIAMAETATYDAIYTSENPIPDIAERVRPAVVLVTVYAENWDAATRVSSVDKLGLGSGCYIRADEDGNGGYILTNNHIVTDADSYTIQWLGSDEEQDVELVGTDDGTDIAVLHFEGAAPEGVAPIPLGDSDALRIGELAISGVGAAITNAIRCSALISRAPPGRRSPCTRGSSSPSRSSPSSPRWRR